MALAWEMLDNKIVGNEDQCKGVRNVRVGV